MSVIHAADLQGTERQSMTDPEPLKPAANEGQVTIEHEGRLVTGTFSVWAGMVTVRSSGGHKTADLGESSAAGLARIMLRELAQDGKA
jgi:hypothetical protein